MRIEATCMLFGALLAGLGATAATVRMAQAEPKLDGSDPAAIMAEVFRQMGGERRSSRMKLTISDDSGSRERGMLMRSSHSKDARKTLIIIDSPADTRGTGFLSIDYVAPDKSDERWLYLPGLKRTTRIAGGQLSGAFLGSDF